jgi:hypothetical protein
MRVVGYSQAYHLNKIFVFIIFDYCLNKVNRVVHDHLDIPMDISILAHNPYLLDSLGMKILLH